MTQKIHELLETKNRNEQAAKVQALIDLANAPVVDLIIRYDGRFNAVVDVTPIGGNLKLDDALTILEGARRLLMSRQSASEELTETGET